MKNKIEKLGISSREAQELIKTSKNIKKDYKKLKTGYPIQYLIGYSSFYGYKFLINKNTLIPRYETEYLVEKTIKYIKKYFNKNENVNICDLGTGSGCIGITLKKELPNVNVDAYDISLRALIMAKKNSKINNAKVSFYLKNILKPLNKKYDIIISNPPYVGVSEKVMNIVYKYEPKKALYAKENGLQFYKKIITSSVKYLNEKSLIAFEIGKSQGKNIIEIADKTYPNAKKTIEKDLSGKDRYVFIFNNVE